jgi:pimeloyl-ACP methyl ester carboxylesterase
LAADSALFFASRVPAVIIVGSADPVGEDSKRLARWWSGARLVVVENADHNSVLFLPAFMPELRRRLASR